MRAHFAAFILILPSLAFAQNKPYRLPAVDLKQRVIWGSECVVNDNLGLAFGGQDQQSASGSPGTRVRVKGEWQDWRDLLGPRRWDEYRFLHRAAQIQAALLASLRRAYLSDESDPKRKEELAKWTLSNIAGADELRKSSAILFRHDKRMESLIEGLPACERLISDARRVRAEEIQRLAKARFHYQQIADLTSDEPPPRALSPIVYDEKSGLFVLFGGDHFDYLMNDTWVFDPKTLVWELRLPPSAPPPRANHKLVVKGDGTIVLSGGYVYANNYDYMGGQYADIEEQGEWTYDIARNEWSGGKGVSPLARTYRTGKFHPDYFLQGPRPDRAAHGKVLDSLPANTWVSLEPPHLPEMNRDWGTAVLDPDRDLILRWSGGHSAHGGSDVLHYHIATNRWELPFPVEFPLGQTYTNTEYPEGVNFNQRPWVTGHTYQSYGYDVRLKKMLFTGRAKDCFAWDPDEADWTGRFAKPEGMTYDSCFYTLTCTSTPQGLMCWTGQGRLFQFESRNKWVERKLSGEKLPGAVVDNSTIAYDAKRKRLLTVVKPYGDKVRFSGQLHAIDCASWEVTKLEPANRGAAAAIPYLCQLRYDARHDLLLAGCTLPPDAEGLRRTPAYDCTANRWVSLKITGDDPSGAKGRNVSLGMMYDARRELFFAVDTKSRVFALRLDAASADVQALSETP